MKKTSLNVIVDAFLLLLFLPMVSTGLVLFQFPRGLGGVTALGLTRQEWIDIHITISILFLILIGIHLVLHHNWKNVLNGRFSKVWANTLAFAVAALFVATLLAPFLITKHLPNTRGYGNRSGSNVSGGGWGRNAADSDYYQQWQDWQELRE